MAELELSDLGRRATALYEQRWRAQLEQTHRHWFVAIEPDAEEYFLGETLTEAVKKAREKYPDRVSFVLRVGHRAAVEIGASTG